MTPRQATVLLVFTLVTVVAAAAVPVVHAQDAAAPQKVRTVTIAAQENSTFCPPDKAPCWDVPIIVVAPGDHLQIIVNLEGSAQPHDFHLALASGEVVAPAKATIGGSYTLNVTLPADVTTVAYRCAVHPTTMIGKLSIASALGATEAPSVPELGVHFLSYWVGLIAFMLLFIVYGATFFLFKYNETPETTDQWERAGEGAPDSARRFSPGMASILAILLSAVLIAAVVYLARR